MSREESKSCRGVDSDRGRASVGAPQFPALPGKISRLLAGCAIYQPDGSYYSLVAGEVVHFSESGEVT